MQRVIIGDSRVRYSSPQIKLVEPSVMIWADPYLHMVCENVSYYKVESNCTIHNFTYKHIRLYLSCSLGSLTF